MPESVHSKTIFNPPRIVIIGGGFGGLETAKRLRRTNANVTLVDRHNYHLFQPLLYQVATGGLSPANIATPLRSIVRKQRNCEVVMAEVVDFNVEKQNVVLADGVLPYDVLVLAAGATHSYFGHDEWASVAPGLKSIGDAAEIRRRIYSAFEAAEREEDNDIRKMLMTFVVVGGGPTGVELAGALSEIARHTLKHDFRRIQPAEARIIIVEAAPHILAHFPEDLCKRAAEKVRQLGIELHLHSKVTQITSEAVHLSTPDGEAIVPTATVLWGAGVQANPLGKKLAFAVETVSDRAGRLQVKNTCQIDRFENIFAIGDIAACPDATGKLLPGLASVAVQQGGYVAKALDKIISDFSEQAKSDGSLELDWKQVLRSTSIPPFVYKDKGSMATIGRAAAVAKIGKSQFCGFFAWLLWLFVHLMLIVQFQNRVLIFFQWAWSYVTFNRSNRIITGEKTIEVLAKPAADSFQPNDISHQERI